jgi:hypothetical protein
MKGKKCSPELLQDLYDMTGAREVVKLVHNSKVKDLLEKAKKEEHEIKAEGDYFIVRDKKSFSILFKGIKIRTDLWGLTFELH